MKTIQSFCQNILRLIVYSRLESFVSRSEVKPVSNQLNVQRKWIMPIL